MHYELWDLQSGNLVGEYDTEARALAIVRSALRVHGTGYVETLALALEHDEGDPSEADLPPPLQGVALVQRALAVDSDKDRRSA